MDDDNESKTEGKHKRRFAIKIVTRGALIRIGVLAVFLAVFCIWAYFTMIKMPGKSYSGQLPDLTEAQVVLRDELRSDVEMLAGTIGERNVFNYKNLCTAADYLQQACEKVGLKVCRQSYTAMAETFDNIEAELPGPSRPEKIIVIGAHYDSVLGSPGANDNISAVAATLALARRFAEKNVGPTMRFVFFANEEAPFYHTDEMGSMVYAKSCRENGDDIIAMISVETIGYYTDEPDSQSYPFPFNLVYPPVGNFIAFISNTGPSAALLRECIGVFREKCEFPSEGGAIPGFIPGVGWSDHWSFWQYDYPAIMVTDTAPFRYPHYHQAEDTPDKLDYDRMARVVSGLETVITHLTGSPGQPDNNSPK